MQKYKELVELINWCKLIFNDSCTKININDVDVNLDEEITEELCKQISNSMDQDEEEWYDIFLFPDKLSFLNLYVAIMTFKGPYNSMASRSNPSALGPRPQKHSLLPHPSAPLTSALGRYSGSTSRGCIPRDQHSL